MKLAEAGLTGEILAGADQNYNIPGPHFLVHTTYLLDPRITLLLQSSFTPSLPPHGLSQILDRILDI